MQKERGLLLGQRLKTALSLIDSPAVFADIGCDHGYAACFTAMHNESARIIACDISQNALAKSRLNAEKFFVKNRIEFRLGSGLTPLKTGEAETALIAGMGAYRIIGIIDAEILKARGLKRLVLGANRDVPALRAYLMRNGFAIECEALAYENGIFYEFIAGVYNGAHIIPTLLDCEVGKSLIKKHDPLLRQYLEYRIKKLDGILLKSQKQANRHSLLYKNELKNKLRELLSCL